MGRLIDGDKLIEDLRRYGHENISVDGLEGIIALIPSANPERKTGKWIVHYECPKCGESTKDFTEYCPFCNADMKEGDKNDAIH